MYKGTHDGDIDEIKFVSIFNSNKKNFKNYLNKFSDFSEDNLFMVRVTTKQFSNLSEKKVFTRADCYLANFNSNISSILEENDYYLSEEILKKNNVSYEKIEFSGISIKMTNSKNFQILKTGANSFQKLFGSYELGAGASLFCKNPEELEKNYDLILGWNSSIENMATFFSEYTQENENFYLDKSSCEKIKNYSCQKIKDIISNSPELQQKIFNGITLYDEPYTAFYFYHGNDIKELTYIPFTVTTGSGRSRGDYTIVLKPISNI